MTHNKKGFTLIELLVVIAIIGILSAIGLVSLNGAREKARDAQRKSDMGTIKTALVLFSDDNGGKYPSVGPVVDVPLPLHDGSGNPTATGNHLVPAYMPKIPVDPVNDATYKYEYLSNDHSGAGNKTATKYALLANMQSAGGTSRIYVLNDDGYGGEQTRGTYTCELTAGAGKLNVCEANPAIIP